MIGPASQNIPCAPQTCRNLKHTFHVVPSLHRRWLCLLSFSRVKTGDQSGGDSSQGREITAFCYHLKVSHSKPGKMGSVIVMSQRSRTESKQSINLLSAKGLTRKQGKHFTLLSVKVIVYEIGIHDLSLLSVKVIVYEIGIHDLTLLSVKEEDYRWLFKQFCFYQSYKR